MVRRWAYHAYRPLDVTGSLFSCRVMSLSSNSSSFLPTIGFRESYKKILARDIEGSINIDKPIEAPFLS